MRFWMSYHIFIFTYFFAIGSCLYAQTPSDNCDISAAYQLVVGASCNPLSYTIDTPLGAPASPTCGLNVGAGEDGWGWFVATSASTTVTYANTNRDAMIFIYVDNGTPCSGLTQVACADAYGSGASTETIAFPTAIGTRYYVRIVRYTGTSGTMGGTICVYSMPSIANDPCNGAFPAACGNVYSGTTVGATTEVIPGGCGNTTSNSVWYSVVGDGSVMTASLCGSGYDSQIGIFQGTCASLSCVSSNDDFCGLQSQVSWTSVAGVTYYIRIMGYGSSAGSFILNLSCILPSGNDPCSGAVAVACGQTITGTTVGATPETIPAGCGSAISPSLWYTFTGDGATYTIDLCGSAFDTNLSLYTGGCTGLTCLQYNDDFCGLQSSITFNSTVGTVYYIQVHGFGAASGAFTMNIDCYTETANDPCSGALPITCGQTISASTSTFNPDIIPFGCGFSVSGGVWYSFAGTGEMITASLCGSAFDTQISVFTGTCAGLTCINTNDDLCGLQSEVAFLSYAGTTYYILVHGSFDEGSFNLSLSCDVYVPGPQDCGGALPICTDTQFGGNSAGPGFSNDLDLSNQGCLWGENQTSWYIFQPITTGSISFTINPTPIVDYDFAIWGPMTAPTCPPSGAPLRCSYSGLWTATGLGNGATDPSEGAGGDAWVSPITIGAGQVNSYYIMCLDNFSTTTTPFVFDWALSGVILNCSIYLPVELTDFGGEETGPINSLYWRTESEINNERFEIWSSVDGTAFDKIGEVNGNGSCQNSHDYIFSDRNPSALLTYYKLKQFDFNGTFQWSETIAVTRIASFSISPNPAEELLHISYISTSESEVTLQLSDVAGRIVHSQKLSVGAQGGQLEFDLGGFPAGIYQLNAHDISGSMIYSEKVLKN
ncbi:MAG: T9SS type A sorting domain-containing protein [Flavobacteriales bacterium]